MMEPKSRSPHINLSTYTYWEIAKNILKMKAISLEQRQKILERAEKTLPIELSEEVDKLTDDMASERKVYEITGLDSDKGPPRD